MQRGRVAVHFASVQGLQDLMGPKDYKARRCHLVATIFLSGPRFGVGETETEWLNLQPSIDADVR